MVGIAAAHGDFRDGHVGEQQAVRVFQTGLVDHLPRRQVEHALAIPLQLRDGHARDARELLHGHRAAEMAAYVRFHRRQPPVGRMRAAGRGQVDRNAHQADDRIAAVADRPLVREAPARLPAAEQVQLQLVLQDHALLQHAPVLLGVSRPQVRGKHLRAGLAEQRRQPLQAAALHQRAVSQQIARLQILDEYRGGGHRVQNRQEQRQARYQLFDTLGAMRSACAIHELQQGLHHGHPVSGAFGRPKLWTCRTRRVNARLRSRGAPRRRNRSRHRDCADFIVPGGKNHQAPARPRAQ
ncbi:hypothetical protein AD428_09950 [Achromobacter sp. DMS1]|nr:hypothetical protein AD428_09950 [Achromobacter sp. DMS1]